MLDLRELREFVYTFGMSLARITATTQIAPTQAEAAAVEFVRANLPDQDENAMLVLASGVTLRLPNALYEALRRSAEILARGDVVQVATSDQRRITTQQAADILGISRSTLVRLLDEGALPYERYGDGRHRRLNLSDVMAFQAHQQSRKHELMTRLTADSQEFLNDTSDVSLSEAAQIVRKIRHA